MDILHILSWLLLVLALLVIASMKVQSARYSMFELKRRAERSETIAKELKRQEQAPDIEALLRIFTAILLVATIISALAVFGWLLGTVIATIVVLQYRVIASLWFIMRLGERLYAYSEPYLVWVIERTMPVLRLFRIRPDTEIRAVGSKEELLHIVEQSPDALTVGDKKLLRHSLTFGARLVSEVMTPRSVIESIDHKELIGPLTLDDLHKTGHSRFPVVEGDIDHVIGMLHMRDLITLKSKSSLTAAKAMEPRVFYIREDQTLGHALTAFLKTHHHLFVVVNEYRETVGLLSLEDVIEAMMGQKIVDEFDAHDDLRAVAARNPRDNNEPDQATDV